MIEKGITAATSYLVLRTDVFTSRCNRAKVMVTMRKQCARARDVHESGKTSTHGSPINCSIRLHLGGQTFAIAQPQVLDPSSAHQPREKGVSVVPMDITGCHSLGHACDSFDTSWLIYRLVQSTTRALRLRINSHFLQHNNNSTARLPVEPVC
jgi:hypothetical protein